MPKNDDAKQPVAGEPKITRVEPGARGEPRRWTARVELIEGGYLDSRQRKTPYMMTLRPAHALDHTFPVTVPSNFAKDVQGKEVKAGRTYEFPIARYPHSNSSYGFHLHNTIIYPHHKVTGNPVPSDAFIPPHEKQGAEEGPQRNDLKPPARDPELKS